MSGMRGSGRAGGAECVGPIPRSFIDRVARHAEGYRPNTPVPRLGLATAAGGRKAEAGSFGPLISVVLQGAKQLIVGDRELRYEAGDCFCCTVPLHTDACVVEASPSDPYVAVSLMVEPHSLADLLAELPPSSHDGPDATFGVAAASPMLIDALDGLAALLDTPEDIPILAPGREREALYRLLQGGHGPMLRNLAHRQGRLARVRRAVDRIESHYDRPLSSRDLADLAGMSVPSLHRHFRAATGMSPLQYQKATRLQAARRLLLADVQVARAAHLTGYESSSQFSRDYLRFFGVRPSAETAGDARIPLLAMVFSDAPRAPPHDPSPP